MAAWLPLRTGGFWLRVSGAEHLKNPDLGIGPGLVLWMFPPYTVGLVVPPMRTPIKDLLL